MTWAGSRDKAGGSVYLWSADEVMTSRSGHFGRGEEAQEPEMGTRTSGVEQAGLGGGRCLQMGPAEGEPEPRAVEGQQSLVSQEPVVPGGSVLGRHMGVAQCWLRGVMLAAGSIVISSNKKKG